MIPASNSTIAEIEFSEEKILPSLTFEIDFEKKKIKGTIDDIESLKQSVFCRLMTVRGENRICDDNYGLPLFDLLGKTAPLVYVLLANSITQTLLEDDRILAVSGFVFDTDRKSVTVSFFIQSVFGIVNFEEVIL